MKHFTEFNQKYSTNKMYAPRVLHLRAYLYVLAGHEALANAILNKAVILCQQHGNKLEESWIAQNQISWFGVFRQSTSNWFTSTLTMPSWEEARGMDPEELAHTRYTLMGVGGEIWADNSSLYLAPKAEDTQLLKGQG